MHSETSLTVPQGPKGVPLLGNAIPLTRDPLGFIQRVAEHGDIVRFRAWNRELFLLSHPDLIREALVVQHKSFVKGRGLDAARFLLGNGLLTSEGDFHRRQRRLAQPAFHHQRITGYATTMVECATSLQRRWEPGKTIDVGQDMMALTLEIVAKALFGTNIGSAIQTISHALDMLMSSFVPGLLPLLFLLQRLRLPGLVQRLHQSREDLYRVIDQMIAERRASGEDRGDLLSMLLLAQDTEGDGERMTEVQLRDEVITLVIAGHETTANALAWTWYLLSQHPEVESRLHAELDSVLAGRPPRAEDYPRLRCTEQILSEAMRLYPPAWAIGRRAIEDVVIGGHRIPAQSIVLVSQWIMHRKPTCFPEPHRFLPERWTPEFKASLPKLAYFPFGAGSRMCIGEGFAWMEGVLVLATLAQRWRLALVPGQRIEPFPRITLRPRHGIQMKLSPRA